MLIDPQGRNPVMRSVRDFFASHPDVALGKEDPESVCQLCFDSLRQNQIPNRSVLNGFVSESAPPHLPRLNFIEAMLIQVSFLNNFYLTFDFLNGAFTFMDKFLF